MENPTPYQFKQRELSGEGLKERRELLENGFFDRSEAEAKGFEREVGKKPNNENVEALKLYEKRQQEWEEGKQDRRKIWEEEHGKIYMEGLLNDISKEKKRIGGNWAVAGADLRRKSMRNFSRYVFRFFSRESNSRIANVH